MTDAPKNVWEALLVLQADPIVLTKDKAGQVGNQRTKYADLVQANAVILPKLTELGLAWITSPTLRMVAGANGQEDPRFVLDWKLRHVASETEVAGVYPLPAGANPMQNGSAITYARRYALLAVTNAVADDDDDDGGGYRGRQGMAQRANIRQERTTPAEPTAQRAAPAARAERARPAQRPELPAPVSPAPAGPHGPVRGRGGLITEPMTKKLAITMRQALGDDPGTRKQYIVDMIGREVASSKDLTFDEGRGLIDAFEKANQDADTAAATVIDIYRRTTGGSRSDTVESDVAPELTAAIRAGQWKTVQSYADDPGGYGPNIDAAKGALAGASVQKPVTRQPGQRSRNAAEAIGTGDMGTEQAPWETGEMQV